MLLALKRFFALSLSVISVPMAEQPAGDSSSVSGIAFCLSERSGCKRELGVPVQEGEGTAGGSGGWKAVDCWLPDFAQSEAVGKVA